MAAEDQPPRSAWYTSLDSNTLQGHKLGSVSPTDTKGILSLIEMGKLADVSFGDWLKRRRKGLGLTQQQLAAQINCSTVTLKKIEAEERRPSAQIVERLAEIFDIHPNEQTKFLRFARGDWQAIPSQEIEDAPWRVSYVAPRSNLPASTTSFIGRKNEQDEIKNLIAKNRLVTLIGAGGIGKTRLSIQTAFTLLSDFPHGIWLIELAPLSDPALVGQAIVNTVGLIEQANLSPQTVLMDFLKDKQALLIVDNCEHLIQACAQLTDTLLHSCPDLHILATSREALDITGETLYRVPVLTTPDPVHSTLESLSQYEAVQLFLERAQSGLPDFSLAPSNALTIAQVCRHLDGIPLALELAAARVKGLSVEQIASRLDDRFSLLTSGNRTALPRHQTLRAMIDWSHDLLTEPERILLRRLSIFAGGWTLEGAEAVCASDAIESNRILDLLLRLVDKSLVIAETQKSETYYHMLETIRQYAHEKLWQAGEGELMRQRHLAYFVDLAERAEPHLRAFGMVMWLDRLEVELDNIRIALEYALESDIESQLRIAGALLWFWHIRNHKSEGTEWLERALSIEAMERGNQTLTPGRAMIRGKALYVAGFLRLMFWETNKGGMLSEESLTLFRELGSAGKRGMAYALWNLGVVEGQQPDPDLRRMKELRQESLALFYEVGDKFGIAQSLPRVPDAVLVDSDYEQTRAITEEVLALRKEIGDKDGIAMSLIQLGSLASQQGDYQQAIALCESGLTLFRELGNKWGIYTALIFLGRAAQGQGYYGQATTVLEEALDFAQDSGNKFLSARVLNDLGAVAAAQGDYKQAAKRYEEEVAIGRQIGNTGHIANGIRGLGKVAWAQDDYEQAIKKFDETMAISQEARSQFGTVLALYGLGRVAQSQGDSASARTLHTEGVMLYRGRVFLYWEIVGAAYHLEAFAILASTQKQMKRAACLFSLAEKFHTSLRFEMSAAERAEHDQAIATARAMLGEEAFGAAWEEGRAMTMEQAVAYALEESGD